MLRFVAETIKSVTISGGLSSLGADDIEESFVERVDTYLYEAKNAGRNMIKSDYETKPPRGLARNK